MKCGQIQMLCTHDQNRYPMIKRSTFSGLIVEKLAVKPYILERVGNIRISCCLKEFAMRELRLLNAT